MSARKIPLASIKDGGAQTRVEMHPETIADYAADMLDGAVFPPVIVDQGRRRADARRDAP